MQQEDRTTIKELKEDIVDDYSQWLDVAFTSTIDEMGLKSASLSNFELKIDNLIKLIQNGEIKPRIEGTVAGSPQKW
jgi:hypothetical protein